MIMTSLLWRKRNPGGRIERLAVIRKAAKRSLPSSCACFGGVNQLKNRFQDPAWVKQVYGHPIETNDTARPRRFRHVDLRICGVR
jgi:hypothetical protein